MEKICFKSEERAAKERLSQQMIFVKKIGLKIIFIQWNFWVVLTHDFMVIRLDYYGTV